MFSKINLISVWMLYLLLLAGAVVRTTGSGMGCPDWPKCFGMTIPPTSEDQLPENYQEIYKDHGYAEQGFNVYKTWTEYINRLIGALTGLFFLAQFALAFKTTENKGFNIILSGSILLLTAFQAWLGGKVVESNLSYSLVTWHMILAVFILLLLLCLRFSVLYQAGFKFNLSHIVSGLALIFVLIQIVLGTQVREQVDALIKSGIEDRSLWLNMLDNLFEWHREMYIVLTFMVIVLVLQQYKKAKTSPLRRMVLFASIIVLIQGGTGFMMSYLSFPPIACNFIVLRIVLVSIIAGNF
jgi:heme a synthase